MFTGTHRNGVGTLDQKTTCSADVHVDKDGIVMFLFHGTGILTYIDP